MNKNLSILRWSFLAGAIYFAGVAAMHLLGLKIPVFFVYFDVPSYAYQDSIIGSLALGWSVFLFAAFWAPEKNPHLTKAVLIAGAGTLAGLALTNLRTDFSALAPGLDPTVYWLEVGGLCLYLAWLVVFYVRSGAAPK